MAVVKGVTAAAVGAIADAAINLSKRALVELDDVKLFGDALWYTYDYEIVSPNEHLVGRGMSMCRKDGVRWRILNMHNSLRQPGLPRW